MLIGGCRRSKGKRDACSSFKSRVGSLSQNRTAEAPEQTDVGEAASRGRPKRKGYLCGRQTDLEKRGNKCACQGIRVVGVFYR